MAVGSGKPPFPPSPFAQLPLLMGLGDRIATSWAAQAWPHSALIPATRCGPWHRVPLRTMASTVYSHRCSPPLLWTRGPRPARMGDEGGDASTAADPRDAGLVLGDHGRHGWVGDEGGDASPAAGLPAP